MDNKPKLIFSARLGANVGNGWVPIVNDLYTKALAIDPFLQVDQVKEKFGCLRFYFTSEKWWQVQHLEELAYLQCRETCEFCGSTQNVECSSGDSGWYKTLCSQCRTKWNTGVRPWDEDW